jgi:hypothetical protein
MATRTGGQQIVVLVTTLCGVIISTVIAGFFTKIFFLPIHFFWSAICGLIGFLVGRFFTSR